MSKHSTPKPVTGGVAPEGQRLSGPGTRSKNPQKYDRNDHLKGSNSRKRATRA